MQVKKYLGDNIQEVIWKVKADLGPEAVIIHSHKFKEGGILGIWGVKEKVEVVAAIMSEEDEASKIAQEASNAINFTNIEKQISELKAFVQSNLGKTALDNSYPHYIEKIQQHFLQQELEKSLIDKLLKKISMQPEGKWQECLLQALQEEVKIATPIETVSGKPKLIVLIGPTGVGKTTTLAKLTAYFSLLEKKEVVLLTADTYRIAAVEQLKTYGQIMDIPVEAVYTAEELQSAVERYKNKDLLFLDTAGRSPKNKEQMTELQELLHTVNADEVYLVLSATTRYKDLQEIVNSFAQAGFDKLIITKLDETNSLGPIYSLLSLSEKPVAYLAVGQNVPDDIKKATSQELIKPLLEELVE